MKTSIGMMTDLKITMPFCEVCYLDYLALRGMYFFGLLNFGLSEWAFLTSLVGENCSHVLGKEI